jgi:hypothetical protein
MDHDREDPLTAGEDDDEYEGYIYEEADEDDDDDDEYNDDGNDHTNVEDMEDDEDYEDEEDEEDVDDDDDDNDEENYIDEDVDEDDDEDTGTMSLAELFSGAGKPFYSMMSILLFYSAKISPLSKYNAEVSLT